MRYLVLVTDYDGTLAMDGKADESTLSAVERLRMSGRRAILLTGRQLDDLLTVCPRLAVFDYVVAENGAVTLPATNPAADASRQTAAGAVFTALAGTHRQFDRPLGR